MFKKVLLSIGAGLLMFSSGVSAVGMNSTVSANSEYSSSKTEKPKVTLTLGLVSRQRISKYAVGQSDAGTYVKAIRLKSGQVITWTKNGENKKYPLVGNLVDSRSQQVITSDFARWDNVCRNVRSKTKDHSLAGHWYLEEYQLSPVHGKKYESKYPFFTKDTGYRIVHYVPYHQYHWIDAK